MCQGDACMLRVETMISSQRPHTVKLWPDCCLSCRPLMSCCCSSAEAGSSTTDPQDRTLLTWCCTLKASMVLQQSRRASTLPPGCWRSPLFRLKKWLAKTLQTSMPQATFSGVSLLHMKGRISCLSHSHSGLLCRLEPTERFEMS